MTVVAFGIGAGLYDAAYATLGRQFGAGAGSAITTPTLWGGFASTLCWPLSAYMVDIGWRGSCFVYAGIQLGVSLPADPVRNPASARPAGAGPRGPAGDGATGPPRAPAVPAVRRPASNGRHHHFHRRRPPLTLLQAKGHALAAAVSLGALMGPSQVGAQVIEMLGGGRHHPL